MTDPKLDAENEELKSWYKGVLDNVVKEMIRAEVITGAAVEAAPVWAVPNRLLIAKVWEVSRKNSFVWAIAGGDWITDHINGSLATNPRDAARHFSLKWQMDADRMLEMAKTKTSDENTRANVETVVNKLIYQAESLYELTNREAGWQ
jgi:hypothetical protein